MSMLSSKYPTQGRLTLMVKDWKPNGSYSIIVSSMDTSTKSKSMDRLLSFFSYQENLYSIQSHTHFSSRTTNKIIENPMERVESYNWNDITLDKIIKVKFVLPKGNKYYLKTMKSIINEGLVWDGKIYDFLASKDPTDCAYFLLRDHSYRRFDAICLRTNLLCFKALNSISSIGSRLGLLFSNTCHGISSQAILITVIDDINVVDKTGKTICLTDGSGFLSYDLACKLPNHVIQGQRISKISYDFYSQSNHAMISSPVSSSAPIPTPIPAAVFQVRIFSEQYGLFKGTLVLKHDLPNNTLILRKSMLKVPPNRLSTVESFDYNKDGNSNIINNSNTEKKNQLVTIDVVNTCKESSKLQYFGTLNRHLILLLHACGVPSWIFENIIRKECRILQFMTISKSTAIQRLERDVTYNPRFISQKLSPPNLDSEEDICLRILQHGGNLNEPFVQAILWKIYRRDLENLFELRLPIHPAAYLMGIPDPLDLLEPNQIFLYFKNTIDSNDNRSHGFLMDEDIIVTRFPLLQTKSITIFQNISSPKHIEYFTISHSSTMHHIPSYNPPLGAMIVFSTKTWCSNTIDNQNRNWNRFDDYKGPVESMGGDYDGDLYFVCGDQNLVSSMKYNRQHHKVDESITVNNNFNRNLKEDNGYDIYSNKCEHQYHGEHEYEYNHEHEPLIMAPILSKPKITYDMNSYELEDSMNPHSVDSSDNIIHESIIHEDRVEKIGNHVNDKYLDEPTQSMISDMNTIILNFDQLCSSPIQSKHTDKKSVDWSNFNETKDKENIDYQVISNNQMVIETIPEQIERIETRETTEKLTNDRQNGFPMKSYSSSLSWNFNSSVDENTVLCNRIDNLLNAIPNQLSDVDLQEALWWEYVISAHPNNRRSYCIGNYSNQWLIAADRYGPNSTEAIKLATLHDNAMDYRKHGILSYSTDNMTDDGYVVDDYGTMTSYDILIGSTINKSMNRKPIAFSILPHYLERKSMMLLSSSYGLSSTESYLYDRISENIEKFDVDVRNQVYKIIVEDGIILDSRIKITGAQNYLRFAQYVLKRYTDDVKGLRETHYTSSSSLTAYSKSNDNERKHQMEEDNNSSNNNNDISKVTLYSQNKLGLLHRYRAVLHETISIVSQRLHQPMQSIRQNIASAIYEVCYLTARNYQSYLHSENISSSLASKPFPFNTAIQSNSYAMIDLSAKNILRNTRIPWLLMYEDLLDIQTQYDRAYNYQNNQIDCLTGVSSISVAELLAQLDQGDLKPNMAFNFVPPPPPSSSSI